MICILLYGLCGTGKSTFARRAERLYSVHSLQVRRLFESIVGKDQAPQVYHNICKENSSRTAWLDHISAEIKSNLLGNEINLIEGLFTKEESEWFESFSTVYTLYLQNNNYNVRLERYTLREGFSSSEAQERLSLSDEGRNVAGVAKARAFADYVIVNDGDLDEFYKEIDSIMEQVTRYPILLKLCHQINKEKPFKFTPDGIAYYIRHISIADGCKNACEHCFSSAPSRITQTNLAGFSAIISEIGGVVSKTGRPLSFFHLGASTDPASIREYHMYLQVWRRSFPEFQTIRVFTHGWNLFDHEQIKEMDSTLDVARRYDNIKFVISFDEFSKAARNNWNLYIKNIVSNVRKIIDAVGKRRVRIEVFYSPSRNKCDEKYTLQYWHNLSVQGNCPSLESIIDICQSAEDPTDLECAKVTSGLMSVLMNAGLNPGDLVDMSRDCQTVFNAGRAKQFYKNESKESIQKGLDIQKKKVLYSLEDYEHGYEGLIVHPEGQAQYVDYHGFRLQAFVSGGKKIVPCLSSSKYDASTSKDIRRRILKMSLDAHVAHIPSAFSMCDYLGVLFHTLVSPYTHRFVLGKPFGAQSYYALFSHYGWIGHDLSRYGSMDQEWRYIIQKEHPLVTYIDETMGNCLSVAAGIAMAGQKVFVNISDAAFQEGTIWESALFAGARGLSNLIMAVDNNDMQALGRISDILDLGILETKLDSFGWEVHSCDGHDLDAIRSVAEQIIMNEHTKPVAMVFHTKKGHGVSFIEGDSSWHYKLLGEDDYNKAVNELI